jgi:hypothetical protein
MRLVTALASALILAAPPPMLPCAPTHVRFIGYVTPSAARIRARMASAGRHELVARAIGGGAAQRAVGNASTNSDLCVVWEPGSLSPNKRCRYEIEELGDDRAGAAAQEFSTPALPNSFLSIDVDTRREPELLTARFVGEGGQALFALELADPDPR